MASAVSAIQPSNCGPVGSDMIGKKWSKVQAVSNPTASAVCQTSTSSCQVTCWGPVWIPNRIFRSIARPRTSSGRLPLAVDVVEQDVVTQAVGAGKECPAAVHPRHLFDERHQVVVVVQHEGIDHDVLAGAALHLEQGLLKGFRQRRVKEHRLPPLHVSGWLAVSDDDHLLVSGLVPAQELAGEHQGLLDFQVEGIAELINLCLV